MEGLLNSFVQGLIVAAKRYRDKKLEWEQRERERLEAERLRAERERLRRWQERLVNDLNSRVNDWQEARLIRDFADAVENDAVQRDGPIDADSELALWLKWVRQRSDRMEANALGTILELRKQPRDTSVPWTHRAPEDDQVDIRTLLEVG